jgi:hypothetical protein
VQVRSSKTDRSSRLPAGARQLAVLLAILVTLMGSVAGAQTPDSTATPSAAASPTAAVVIADVAELGEVVWARDIDPATNAPVRQATGFVTTDPAIHAVVPVIRILQGTVVAARWSFKGAPVPALDAEVTADRSYENGWIAFTLTRPDDQIWPIGEYGITILVNGVEALSASMIVRVPPA